MRFEAATALVAFYTRAALVTPDGEVLLLAGEAVRRAIDGPVLLVHAPATLRRLGLHDLPNPPTFNLPTFDLPTFDLPTFDLLELFAFVLPAESASPTPRGLALALGIPPPDDGLESEAIALHGIAAALLGRLAASRGIARNAEAAALAARMGQAGWPWATDVLAALGEPAAQPSATPLRIWRRLPEWQETAPRPAPAAHPVGPAEARARLAAIVGADAEQRPGQADYADAAAAAFAPRERRGDPHLVLAEAGTGTGKTLGYIAPASLWAERNGGAVWVSTYTRHLQRQIDGELARLYPDPAERRRRAVVRKGRENYLCLLNYEEAVTAAGSGLAPARLLIAVALLSRWAMVTADGDLQGGDLPGWLVELFGAAATTGLADRRGECIYAACPHWKRCYVEHTIRRARSADLVVANHALVMAQAAHGLSYGGGLDDATMPTRYVFDEGHHVFDAADSAFSAELSGIETAELRRWLLGAEGARSRFRGLRARLDDLVAGRPALEALLDAALLAARALAAPGWSGRLGDGAVTPGPGGAAPERRNPTEAFLAEVRRIVLARLAGQMPPAPKADLEVGLYPLSEPMVAAGLALAEALARLEAPLRDLVRLLAARLADEAEDLDSATRARLEAMTRSLQRRALSRLTAWRAMLTRLAEAPPEPGATAAYIDLLRLARRDGRDRDAGLRRHHLDPTIPFAATLAAAAQGLLITSATLRDAGEADAETAWRAAEARVGAIHLPTPATRATVASPFDYAAQTRVYVVTDVAPEAGAVAAAYRALFLAAGGGGLGLFTAISRLRDVHARIAASLEAEGIPLLAQHVDAMDNATLVDVFRTEEASCLLGTDAMRDGVDVPGRALRLVVFDRVPWPRPDILHRERRIHLAEGNPTAYDDRIARLRLRQAYGRLIRRASDRGVFVLLDRRTPSRLLSAFPLAAERAGLTAVLEATRSFLGAA